MPNVESDIILLWIVLHLLTLISILLLIHLSIVHLECLSIVSTSKDYSESNILSKTIHYQMLMKTHSHSIRNHIDISNDHPSLKSEIHQFLQPDWIFLIFYFRLVISLYQSDSVSQTSV